jgi:hypothetical protein
VFDEIESTAGHLRGERISDRDFSRARPYQLMPCAQLPAPIERTTDAVGVTGLEMNDHDDGCAAAERISSAAGRISSEVVGGRGTPAAWWTNIVKIESSVGAE